MYFKSFAKEMFEINLFPWQEDFANFQEKQKVAWWKRAKGKTEFVALHSLYEALTQTQKKILIYTPYKTNLSFIWEKIRGYIYQHSFLQNHLERDVTAPYYELKFQNGSRLRGFAAEGVSMTGQDCNVLYVDNLDALTKDQFHEEILPLIHFYDLEFLGLTQDNQPEKAALNCFLESYK